MIKDMKKSPSPVTGFPRAPLPAKRARKHIMESKIRQKYAMLMIVIGHMGFGIARTFRF